MKSKVFLAIMLFAIIVSSYKVWQTSAPREISYKELNVLIEKKQIESITFHSDKTITGILSGSLALGTKRFRTIAPPSDMAVDRLIQKVETESPDTNIINEIESPSFITGLLFNWAPILLMIGFWIFFMNRMQTGGQKALSFGKSRARLNQHKEKNTFKDVAGQDEAKEELQEIIEFLKEPQKFQRLGGRIPRGVLLVGPPGTGKTLIARAVAGEANVPFFSISGSDFVEMFVGVGASRVRDLFEQGSKSAPCIIFIDELDAVGRLRGTGIGGGHDEREQTLNQLLVEMDGFKSNDGVIIIAATNRPDVLDPALLRPGRFDRRVVLNRPDIKGREGILHVHTSKIPLGDDVDLNKIARGTSGFSGADLANLINEAAINAARYDKKTVDQNDFEFAKDKVLMGTEKRSMVISDKEKRVTAVHEAGHATLAIFLPHADPLHKVTIIPRGMALGLTQQLPIDDKHNYSQEYLLDNIAVLLGGRAAEELILGEITTGASNDIERATELARRMVSEWGMSKKIGPLDYRIGSEEPFLGRNLAKPREHSEQTAREIDEEIKRIVTEQYEHSMTIIRANKEKVRRLADELIVKETMTGDKIRELIQS